MFFAAPVQHGMKIVVRDGLRDQRWDDVVIRPGRGLGGRVLVERRAATVMG